MLLAMLGNDYPRRLKQIRRAQFYQCLFQGWAVVGRPQKDQVKFRPLPSQEVERPHRVHRVNLSLLFEPRSFKVLANNADRLAVQLNKDRFAGAAGKGLDPHRPGTGKEVKKNAALNSPPQDIEKRLFRLVS